MGYQQLPRVSPKREAATAHTSLGRHTCTHACAEHPADPTDQLTTHHQCTAWGWAGSCRHWGHQEGKGLQVQMGVPEHLLCLAHMPELSWHPDVEGTYCLYPWGTLGWGSAMNPQAPLQLPRILQAPLRTLQPPNSTQPYKIPTCKSPNLFFGHHTSLSASACPGSLRSVRDPAHVPVMPACPQVMPLPTHMPQHWSPNGVAGGGDGTGRKRAEDSSSEKGREEAKVAGSILRCA